VLVDKLDRSDALPHRRCDSRPISEWSVIVLALRAVVGTLGAILLAVRPCKVLQRLKTLRRSIEFRARLNKIHRGGADVTGSKWQSYVITNRVGL